MAAATFTICVIGTNPHAENTTSWRAGRLVEAMEGCSVESIVAALSALERDTTPKGIVDPARWLSHFAGLESHESGKSTKPWVDIIHSGEVVKSTASYRQLLRAEPLNRQSEVPLSADPTPKREADKERFLSKVRKPAGEGCWVWTAAKTRSRVKNSSVKPYGVFRYEGVPQSAHRASYKLFNGAIPPGMNVMHTCDEPTCVNPEHLKLGYQLENMADKIRKDRHWKKGA
jgi:hypothetical protein